MTADKHYYSELLKHYTADEQRATTDMQLSYAQKMQERCKKAIEMLDDGLCAQTVWIFFHG